MKIEITNVSTSKKGTVWLQAKIICGMSADDIKPGDTFSGKKEEKEEDKNGKSE